MLGHAAATKCRRQSNARCTMRLPKSWSPRTDAHCAAAWLLCTPLDTRLISALQGALGWQNAARCRDKFLECNVDCWQCAGISALAGFHPAPHSLPLATGPPRYQAPVELSHPMSQSMTPPSQTLGCDPIVSIPCDSLTSKNKEVQALSPTKNYKSLFLHPSGLVRGWLGPVKRTWALGDKTRAPCSPAIMRIVKQ